MQPDDEEVEEEFEVDETEPKPTRPASKLDLEEPITTSQNDENEYEDDEDDEEEV